MSSDEHMLVVSDQGIVETTERLERSVVEGDGLQLFPILTGPLTEQPAPASEGIIFEQQAEPASLGLELDQSFCLVEIDSGDSDELDVSAKRQKHQQEGVAMLFPFAGTEGASASFGKGAALFDQIKTPVAEEERRELLSHSSITSVLEEVCNCTIQCTVRAGLTHALVHKLRSATLQHSRSTGDRTRFHAGLLRSSRTESCSRHPAELCHGPRYNGQRATKQHYVIGNIDVCASTYAHAHGLTDRGLRAAADLDVEEQVRVSHETISELNDAQELNCSEQRMHAVSFILSHAKNSGAELMPMHDDLKGAEYFHQENGDPDDLCSIRLYETSITSLYCAYEAASEKGLKYTPLNQDDFSDLFYNDRRVMHIYLARQRDSFSICTGCLDWKQQLANARLPADERARLQLEYSQHLKRIAADRLVHTMTSQMPRIERVPGT